MRRFNNVREAVNEVRAARERLSKLTDNERAVLELVLDGLPNKVIARRCDISVRTVELRRANICRKMEVRSAVELLQQFMIAKGLVLLTDDVPRLIHVSQDDAEEE